MEISPPAALWNGAPVREETVANGQRQGSGRIWARPQKSGKGPKYLKHHPTPLSGILEAARTFSDAVLRERSGTKTTAKAFSPATGATGNATQTPDCLYLSRQRQNHSGREWFTMTGIVLCPVPSPRRGRKSGCLRTARTPKENIAMHSAAGSWNSPGGLATGSWPSPDSRRLPGPTTLWRSSKRSLTTGHDWNPFGSSTAPSTR